MPRIILLGTGTCVPVKERGASGAVVEARETRILVDCGSGTLQRMAMAGVDYRAIDAVLLTHIHPDHSLDLVALLFALNYTPGWQRTAPLVIVGPAGLKRFVSALGQVYRWIEPRGYPLEITEVSRETLSLGAFTIEAAGVEHRDLPAVAYRLASEGKTYVFSGDTAFCEGLVQVAREASLLIIEASFPQGEIPGHLSAAEAGRVAALAGVRAVVLTHLYPDCEGHDMRSLCAMEYGGPVIVAHDLMELTYKQGTLTTRDLREPV